VLSVRSHRSSLSEFLQAVGPTTAKCGAIWQMTLDQSVHCSYYIGSETATVTRLLHHFTYNQ